MQATVTVECRSSRRAAFVLCPEVVKSLVPLGVVGAYLLLAGGEPVYVGRSDSCIRHRLTQHPHLGRATHFTWDPSGNAMAAFLTESAWYHRLNGRPAFLNRIHPARPTDNRRRCPFCDRGDTSALAHALSNASHSLNGVSADLYGGDAKTWRS
jgi:hypothetical protein